MEISYLETKQILDTLPLGLYSSRRIEASLDEQAPSSYYNMLEDKIVVAYSNIVSTMQNINNADEYKETAIRSILYHEVSHALLTPKKMKPTEIINIFEDERIETLNKYTFHNVDFKKNIILLNNFQGEAPTDAKTEFYNLVRFRQGDPEDLITVNNIIDRYSIMTATKYNTTYWNWRQPEFSDDIYNYTNEIYQLYNKIAKKWKEPERSLYDDQQEAARKQRNGQSCDQFLKNGQIGSVAEVDDATLETILANANGEQDKSKAGSNVNSKNTLMNNITSIFFDPTLTENLKRILDTFNKKNSGGSSVNAYSGVFNPRNVVREDYKYFDHKMPINGSNKYGTCHLNLWIDDSGSMNGNETLINKLLYSLISIEKTNKNFTFDYFTCADRIEKCDKYKGYEARGGTYLSKEIVPLFRQAQKPNTFVYNLVIFDGQASTDKFLDGNTFKIFDTNNTTIITDDSNKRNLSKNTSSKIIYCNNYVEQFYDNVFKTLQTAFR